MLHGIGGRTIAEAKEAITHDEFLLWVDYIRKRGSLNVGLRLESGFALLATMVNRALGGKAQMHDFTPHLDSPTSQGMDLNDFKRIFGGG